MPMIEAKKLNTTRAKMRLFGVITEDLRRCSMERFMQGNGPANYGGLYSRKLTVWLG